jgi:hypothetical protein
MSTQWCIIQVFNECIVSNGIIIITWSITYSRASFHAHASWIWGWLIHELELELGALTWKWMKMFVDDNFGIDEWHSSIWMKFILLYWMQWGLVFFNSVWKLVFFMNLCKICRSHYFILDVVGIGIKIFKSTSIWGFQRVHLPRKF